jgi:hypothetical protein
MSFYCLQFFQSIPESPVFSTRYKVQKIKNNFCHMSANQKRIYMAKVIFHYRDFVAGTKNGGFRYIQITK